MNCQTSPKSSRLRALSLCKALRMTWLNEIDSRRTSRLCSAQVLAASILILPVEGSFCVDGVYRRAKVASTNLLGEGAWCL